MNNKKKKISQINQIKQKQNYFVKKIENKFVTSYKKEEEKS